MSLEGGDKMDEGKVKRRFNVLGTNEKCSIPWTVIAPHEGQAICNHGQDLEALNRRGGLCWSEIITVLEDRRYIKMDEFIARKKVEDIVKKQICTVQMVQNDEGHYVDDVGCKRGEYVLANGILKAVGHLRHPEIVPAAYNVDKVVERLEELNYYANMNLI